MNAALNYCFKQQAGSQIHKLYIYDDISEHGKLNWSTWEYEESETSAKYFMEQLESIPETDTIELYINSNGGAVKEGTAIMNQLKRHKAHKIGYVDGVAYSIAFMIFQACDMRIMGIGTSALIHNIWIQTQGNAEMLRKTADDLDVLMESNRKILLERSNMSAEQLIDMMNKETYLTPENCLEYGLCDEISYTKTKLEDTPKEPEEEKQQAGKVITLQQLQNAQKEIQQLKQKMAADHFFRQETSELEKIVNEPKQKAKKTLAQLLAGAAAENYKKGEKL